MLLFGSLANQKGVIYLRKLEYFSHLKLNFWAYLACSILLYLAVWRIDFHPDEAIYLAGVPFNLGNDTGLFYHIPYLLFSDGNPTPETGRLVSLGFGICVILAISNCFRAWFPLHQRWIGAVAALTITISYQAFFLFLRVRPEISWVALSAVAIFLLTKLEITGKPIYRYGFLLALLLLPMNHRLSWFSCAFLGGYLVLFDTKKLGIRYIVYAGSAVVLGAFLNVIIRAKIVGANVLTAFGVFIHSPSADVKPSFLAFTKLVFYGSALALNDTAVNSNWFNWISKLPNNPWLSHYLIQNTLWMVMFILPFMGASWRSRYTLTFPLFAYIAFFVSGYFNPTYSVIFTLYCVVGALYLAFERQDWCRYIAVCIVAISFINGLSFLSTRVFNHQQATFFQVEPALRNFVKQLPPNTSLAYPERFTSIAKDYKGKKYVLFKDTLPDNLNYMILDDFDFSMYQFVDDYKSKARAIKHKLHTMCELKDYHLPVYQGDQLLPQDREMKDTVEESRTGSWFFRNSATYTLKVMGKCD